MNTRKFLLLSLAVVATSVLTWIIYNMFAESESYTTMLYKDTGLAPLGDGSEVWGYGVRPGHCTLVLERKKGASKLTTAHGWWERLSIELSQKPRKGELDLRNGSVLIGLACYRYRSEWLVGGRGITGSLTIESIDERALVATYDIKVEAFCDDMAPEFRQREIVFQGSSVFRIASPPERQISSFGPLIQRQSN